VAAFDVLVPVEGIGRISGAIEQRVALHRLWLEPDPEQALVRLAPDVKAIIATSHKAVVDGALMSPVLTAHPTEVRRKSMLTREIEIGEIIDERQRMEGNAPELAESEERLRRAILISPERRSCPYLWASAKSARSFRPRPRFFAPLRYRR